MTSRSDPVVAELIARLRKRALLRISPAEGVITGPINPDGPEAADQLTVLSQRIADLEADRAEYVDLAQMQTEIIAELEDELAEARAALPPPPATNGETK
jgi:hypothetical protein